MFEALILAEREFRLFLTFPKPQKTAERAVRGFSLPPITAKLNVALHIGVFRPLNSFWATHKCSIYVITFVNQLAHSWDSLMDFIVISIKRIMNCDNENHYAPRSKNHRLWTAPPLENETANRTRTWKKLKTAPHRRWGALDRKLHRQTAITPFSLWVMVNRVHQICQWLAANDILYVISALLSREK